MSYQAADNAEAHQSHTAAGAKLFRPHRCQRAHPRPSGSVSACSVPALLGV